MVEQDLWKTADGRMMPVSHMDYQHICAAIRQIEQEAERRYNEDVRSLENGIRKEQPPYARRFLEHTLWRVRRHGPRPDKVHHLYRALCNERDRRDLVSVNKPDEEPEAWWDR